MVSRESFGTPGGLAGTGEGDGRTRGALGHEDGADYVMEMKTFPALERTEYGEQ